MYIPCIFLHIYNLYICINDLIVFSVIVTTYNKGKTSKDNNKLHLSGFPWLPCFQGSFPSCFTSSFSFPDPSQAILFSRILGSTNVSSAYDVFHKLPFSEFSLCNNLFALWCKHLYTGYCDHFI